jgi:hypothetical protein
MFASAYMGRKWILTNAFTPRATILAFGKGLHLVFPPMYAEASMEDFLVASNRNTAAVLATRFSVPP